jgi:hypothetical protein
MLAVLPARWLVFGPVHLAVDDVHQDPSALNVMSCGS